MICSQWAWLHWIAGFLMYWMLFVVVVLLLRSVLRRLRSVRKMQPQSDQLAILFTPTCYYNCWHSYLMLKSRSQSATNKTSLYSDGAPRSILGSCAHIESATDRRLNALAWYSLAGIEVNGVTARDISLLFIHIKIHAQRTYNFMHAQYIYIYIYSSSFVWMTSG